MPKIRKVEQFDKAECIRVGEAIDQALQKVEQQYGVHIKRGNGRFDSSGFSTKIEVSVVGENGEVRNKEAEDFKMFAKSYGLDSSDLGKLFKGWSGKEYQITGLAIRRRKNPILAKRISTGKVFIFPATEIKNLLANSS